MNAGDGRCGMAVPAGALNSREDPDDDGVRARSARRAAVRVRGGGISRASLGRGGRLARSEGAALHSGGSCQRADSAPRRSGGVRRGRRVGGVDGLSRLLQVSPTVRARSSASFRFLPTSTTERSGLPCASGIQATQCGPRASLWMFAEECVRPSVHRIPRIVRSSRKIVEDLDCVWESRSRTIRRFGNGRGRPRGEQSRWP